MRVFGLLMAVAVAQSAALSFAIPIPFFFEPRTQTCASAPTIVVGTTLDRRLVLAPRCRPKTVLWCAPGTSTASDYVSEYLHDTRDQIVSGGRFERDATDTLSLHMWNTNNHQLTWGVMKPAFDALKGYMNESGYGEIQFSIFE